MRFYKGGAAFSQKAVAVWAAAKRISLQSDAVFIGVKISYLSPLLIKNITIETAKKIFKKGR